MAIGADILRQQQDDGKSFQENLQAVEQLEKEGYRVESKGNQAVLVNDKLMVYLYTSRYHNLKTNKRGGFKPGNLKKLAI